MRSLREYTEKWVHHGVEIEVTIKVLDSETFKRKIDLLFDKKVSRLRRRLTRGFHNGYTIYVKEGIKFGEHELIQHELGHIFGYGHTWKPNLMNPVWLLRWIKKPVFWRLVE